MTQPANPYNQIPAQPASQPGGGFVPAPVPQMPAPQQPLSQPPAIQPPAMQPPAMQPAPPGGGAQQMPYAPPAQPPMTAAPMQHAQPAQMPMTAAPMQHAHPAQVPMAPAPSYHTPPPQATNEGGESALPAISVQAFCERTQTAGVIHESTRDWRMKRTNVNIFMGGLPAAIDYYHNESTPGLVMVETGLRGAELFSQLEQLAGVCDAGTKVVIIGAVNDIGLYRQLMEKGISAYIVPPFHPLTLIRSLSELYSDPEQPFQGRVTAFFGAKGGVGSSTMAHNIAWCLAEGIGQETALVDLDTSWGTTGLDYAYDKVSGLEEALANPERLDENLLDRIMLRHTPKLSILPASGSLSSNPITAANAFEAVVDSVRKISPVSILDMPHYWNEWTSHILTSADDIVITATPDLASLRNTANLVEHLKDQRPNDNAPILIFNKTGQSKKNEISLSQFSSAVGMEPALVIGYDPDTFLHAATEGLMLEQVKSAGQIVSGLTYLAGRIKTGTFSESYGSATGGKGKGRSLLKSAGKKGKAQLADNIDAPKKKKSLFSSMSFRK